MGHRAPHLAMPRTGSTAWQPAEQAGAVRESQRANVAGLRNVVWSWYEEENWEYEADKKLLP